jgi:SAM-dependent methyltransferase
VPAAVVRLSEHFPDVPFVAEDVSERAPYPDETFDVVSIMSVLHHVVDDGRFRSALANLASQLAPGGRLIVLDPLVRRSRWMPATAESSHNVVRTTSDWETGAASAGLRIEAVVPTSAFLSDPVDAGSRAVFEAHRLWWRSITAALRGRERVAEIVLPPFAALDRALTRRSRFGVSAKLIVLAAV